MTKPSKREMLKPLELLGIAAAFGIFAGLITLMSTRDFLLTIVLAGIAFIAGLVFLALFALTIKPNKIEQEEIQRDDKGNPKPPTML